MTLTLIADAPTEQGDTIPAGTVVLYRGHVPGGMIRVEWTGGSIRVIHPATTKELR